MLLLKEYNIYFTIKICVDDIKSTNGYRTFLLFDKNAAQKVSDALYFGNVKVENNKVSSTFNNIQKKTYLIAIIHNERDQDLFNKLLGDLASNSINYFETYRDFMVIYRVKKANENSSFNKHIKYKIQIKT